MDSKRTFVLGVVDTSGMKSAAATRKRRWDQPPDEGEEVEGAVPAKVVIKECAVPQAEPVKPQESIEDELQEIFYDTNETILEESPVGDTIPESEPTPSSTSEPVGSESTRTGTVGSLVLDEPEELNSATTDNNIKLASEKVEDEMETTPDAEVPVTYEKVVEGVNVPPPAAVIEEKKSTVKVATAKPLGKKENKTVAPVIISDSLKAIQFCYDEDDSNTSEGSDSEGAAVVIPTVADTKIKENAEAVVQSRSDGEAAEISIEPSLDAIKPEEEVATGARAEVIEEQSLVYPESSVKDISRSPTPVLADEQDETALQATELVDSTVSSSTVQVVDNVEEITTVVEDPTVSSDANESAIITDENSGQDVLPDSSDMYETAQPAGECIIESELVAEAAEVEEGNSDAAKVEYDVLNEFPLGDNVQQVVDESRSPEAFETETADKGLEKGGEFNYKSSLVDSLDAPSDQSDNSKTVVEPLSEKAPSDQNQTNLISMDNSQNCCVSFDDMSNKITSKSPELDSRYPDSEELNDVKISNPEVTMHFASVRTQDGAQTPESAQEEADELKDESALAICALITGNPDLEDKPLDFGEQTQSQNTMEMLDSLVRRSSEDDPSRIREGGGLFSEDSLINEINQLPDQDDSDKIQELSKSSKQGLTNIDRENGAQMLAEGEKSPEIPKSEEVLIETELSEPVTNAPSPLKSVPAHREEIDKTETCTSVEEESSQGVDQSKNVTVSSANILEVIFGSEQKSSGYSKVASLEGGSDVELGKKTREEDSSKAGVVQASYVSEAPVSYSKLQLNNEDFEMGSAEIVAVDPTISLSGEDSDEDAVPSSKPEELLEKVEHKEVQEPENVEVDQVEDDDKRVQYEEEREDVESQDGSEEVTIEDVPLTKDPQVALSDSESVPELPKVVDDDMGLKMGVDETSASNDEVESSNTEKAVTEPMDVEEKTSTPVVDKPSRAVDEQIHAEAPSKSIKEPVPVLIIKKQSLPSKKHGEAVETLLTCSPKSTENVASSSPSRKPPTESLHVDTVQETPPELTSPKHSPITLRIYKDSLTVKTDLDSPKRNKSPLSSEFKSELSPRPGVSDNVSPQNKQLEFTLKIAKDANTNQPKATMSPKHVASPTPVWKSEVNVDASTGKQPRVNADASTEKRSSPLPSTKVEKQPSTLSIATAEKKTPVISEGTAETLPASALSTGDQQDEDSEVKSTPTRGRGRGRGGTPRRTPGGRGRKGVVVAHRGKVEEPVARPDEDATEVKVKVEAQEPTNPPAPSSLGLQMTDAFKRMMSQEKASIPQPEVLQPPPITPVATDVTPVTKKRGRPRKSVQQVLPVPEEIVPIKMEPAEPATPADASGGEAGEDTPSGRPKRTCRGRTKPIVVKKKRGGAAGSAVPRGASTPLPVDPVHIKQEGTPSDGILPTSASGASDTPAASSSPVADKPAHTPAPTPNTISAVLCHKCGTEMRETIRGRDRDGNPRRVHRCPRGGCQVYRFPHRTYEISEAARGRGNFKRPTPDRNTLSEKELAELQKIEAKKEKLRLDRIAKYEAKKAKKLAKKLKDEERRKRQAQEKAEKAAAAAPQVFEEETRMSAPDSNSRGHTPAPSRIILTGDAIGDESQNSTTTPGDSNRGNKKGRMEISIGDLDCLVKDVKVDDLAEYQWQGSELYMIQEQVSLYLGVKSFKRKYPGLKRRTVEAEERTFLEDSGLVPKSMCDLGITAVSSSEILDIMFQDFPDKYEEFRKHVRDKQAREASSKQKAAIGMQKKDGTKVEPREQALEAVASWNANLNRERKEERKCALDLQTFTVHYPKVQREQMAKPTPKVGLYPVAVIPGQFCDYYKKYTPTELMYFPVNTVLYGPLKPNERQKDGSDDGSASESSSSSSSSSSSGESSSESESEGDDPPKCVMCNGTRKKNRESLPEVLLSCVQCKTRYHPSCKEFTPEMTPHLVKYEWQCTACKKCTKCGDPNLKDRIMCCQLCDRGYHLSCIGLKKMPEGRWHCSVCAYCSSCSSRNPGGSDWQHEFKKGEKGTKVYQRTLCTPCFKLWRKGKYCQLCSKCHTMKPEEDPNLIQCNSCDRWLHKECYGTKYGIQDRLLSTSSIQCDICVDRIQNSSISGLNRSLIKV